MLKNIFVCVVVFLFLKYIDCESPSSMTRANITDVIDYFNDLINKESRGQIYHDDYMKQKAQEEAQKLADLDRLEKPALEIKPKFP